jgi:nucleoid-associated protein YgaU
MGIFDFKKPKRPPADFGNVKGGSSTTSPAPEKASADASVMEYRVVKGDSLSKIAERVYGDAQAWRRIYDANRDIIDDPDLIHPGQVLKVPKKEGGNHA